MGDTADFALETHPSVSIPTLTKTFPTDTGLTLDTVADPFCVVDNGTYHLFFEAAQSVYQKICHATSPDGLTWTYDRVVLDETAYGGAVSMSYPLVIKVSGSWYMLPDTFGQNLTVHLFRAVNFPTQWEYFKGLFNPVGWTPVDCTITQWGDNWYVFCGDNTNAQMRLFWSSSFLGVYTEHPSSPMYGGTTIFRPGGRIIRRADSLDLFLQNNNPNYGRKLHRFRITTLSPTEYTAAETDGSPILQASGVESWNKIASHHLDRVSPTLSFTDGHDGIPLTGGWSIAIYRDVS